MQPYYAAQSLVEPLLSIWKSKYPVNKRMVPHPFYFYGLSLLSLRLFDLDNVEHS